MMRETGVENNFIPGQKIVDAALAQLDKHRDDPTYLFLGTIDTHGPWIARKPWIDIYSPGPYHGPFQEFGTAKDLGFKAGSMGCSIIPPPADIERLRAIYDSAVSYHDQQVGRLVAQLKSWGIWDQTMLIITADHGEELFEDQPLRPRRLAARLARARAAARSTIRRGFPPARSSTRAPRASTCCRRCSRRSARRRSTPRRATPLEPLAQGIGARLGAAVVRVDVRVRARDADRPLEGARRPQRRADDRRPGRRSGRDQGLSPRRIRSSAAC